MSSCELAQGPSRVPLASHVAGCSAPLGVKKKKSTLRERRSCGQYDRSSPDDSDEAVCRICLDATEESLFKPCACRGSGGVAHVSCMRRWLANTDGAPRPCPVCAQPWVWDALAECSRRTGTMLPWSMDRLAGAIDPASMISQDESIRCRKGTAGFEAERKEIGKQHFVPCRDMLRQTKEKCTEALEHSVAFREAIRSKTGVDVLAEFVHNINKPFSIYEFTKPGTDGLSPASLYTFLPIVLDHKAKACNESFKALKWLYQELAIFRDVFGSFLNPLADYMPIFEAIVNLVKDAENLGATLEVVGSVTTSLFATLFGSVLDCIGGVLFVLSTPEGQGAALGIGSGLVIGGIICLPEAAGIALLAAGLGLIGSACRVMCSEPHDVAHVVIYFQNAAGSWRLLALNQVNG